MFFREVEKHHTPHIHADHQGQVAAYPIPVGSFFSGELPPGKHNLVVGWIETSWEDLPADRELAGDAKRLFPYSECEAFEPLKNPKNSKWVPLAGTLSNGMARPTFPPVRLKRAGKY
ncbi:MAG: DUF4160 domain-containing protein [Candidatus Sumerlaeia bacterium]|nr:DUF4160 domain-containing protein [Candidatus Sumerlaeia bacterium]